jgi:hypothetical protein
MLTDSAQNCQGFKGFNRASLFLYWSGFHPIGKTEGLHPDILDKASCLPIKPSILDIIRLDPYLELFLMVKLKFVFLGKTATSTVP